MTLTEYLTRHYACRDAVTWAANRPASESLWRECPDASWMLWLCVHIGVRRELMVLCATGCARSVLHLMPAGEERPRIAIETTEEWCYGRATLEQIRAAAYAAYAVYAARAAYAVYAARAARAAYAVYAARAARAAYTDYAVFAARAARAAACSVDANAAAYAADAAAEAGICTREAALCRYARGVRGVIPWWHVADRLRAEGVEG